MVVAVLLVADTSKGCGRSGSSTGISYCSHTWGLYWTVHLLYLCCILFPFQVSGADRPVCIRIIRSC